MMHIAFVIYDIVKAGAVDSKRSLWHRVIWSDTDRIFVFTIVLNWDKSNGEIIVEYSKVSVPILAKWMLY